MALVVTMRQPCDWQGKLNRVTTEGAPELHGVRMWGYVG